MTRKRNWIMWAVFKRNEIVRITDSILQAKSLNEDVRGRIKKVRVTEC